MNRNTFKERDREPTKETHETLVWDTNEDSKKRNLVRSYLPWKFNREDYNLRPVNSKSSSVTITTSLDIFFRTW